MKYTTVENIKLKLRGRLDIGQSTLGSGIGGQVVDDNLIALVGEQREAYIDLILNEIYVLPLSLASPITESILQTLSECLIISQLMRVHFQGSYNASSGGDVQGIGIDAEREAFRILAMLTAGHNIYLPPSDQPPTNGGFQTPPQALVLPLEQLRGLDQPDTITRSYTVTGDRKLSGLNGVDWYSDYDMFNPYPFRVLGSEFTLRYNLRDN